MVIFVNKGARGGEGAARWRNVERELNRRRISYEAETCQGIPQMRDAVSAYAGEGHDVMVAAGGDGTVNALLNILMEKKVRPDAPNLILGAVGLGSSNDFHKPFSKERMLAGTPVRLSRDDARLVDVGRVTLSTVGGGVETRYFFLNLSMGVVADSNARYNEGRGLSALKRHSVEAAILWAAFMALWHFAPVEVILQIDSQKRKRTRVTNLHVLKKIHFAGGMRYDTEVTADDGAFDVVCWADMSRPRIIQLVPRLYMGRVVGHRSVCVTRGKRIRLELAEAANLELDGEVVKATAADIEILSRALMVCG
ncbi:MAG: hypothetical protein H0X28_10540 [Solirubrobacterales bacterium]|nr:hypothetical protein [Solirubrobacterales bacterium]